MNIHELPKQIVDLVGEVENITFPRQGHTSTVAVLDSRNRKYVVKKTESVLYNEWLSREYKALQILKQTGLPVPNVHSFYCEKNTRWLLMEYIRGISLREFLAKEPSSKDKEKAIASFGLCLKQIHECPCPPELIKHDKPWLDTMLQQAEHNLNRYDVDGTAELLSQLQRTRPEPIENTLIHGDFTIDNVLVEDCNIVGIIDWSGAAIGDPRYDVALAIRPKPHAFQNERDKDIFFDAYGRLRISEEEYSYFEDGLYRFF